MTIRTRLTVWYGFGLAASMFLMAGILYYELVLEPAWRREAHKPDDPIEEEIAEIILFYTVPMALLKILGGWWLVRRALGPLNRLATAAERLQVENLHEPLPRTGNGDEVDRLSEVLNASNLRLEQAFNRIQEFTLHASHELKTPLAILHAEIETALNDPAASDAQRESFASQLDEIQRLSHIVENLTFLTKTDVGTVDLPFEPLPLDELVRDAFEDAQILAQSKNITVHLGICESVTVFGNRHRLRQLLLTLTDNAIKYNVTGGRVNLDLVLRDSQACLTIANTGPGISPHNLSRVFDRFFRGDEARRGEVDGCGLGLSIAEWIVKAHHGQILITSTPAQLTTVTITLPTRS